MNVKDKIDDILTIKVYLDGDLPLHKAVELIKQHTRNFSKRQCTWFLNRSESKVIHFNQKNNQKLMKDLLEDINC